MKKLVSSLIIMLLFFTGCSFNQTSDTSLLKLNENKIKQVNLYYSSLEPDIISTTDRQQISNVLNYLNSLNVIETSKTPGQAAGDGRIIEVELENNSVRTFDFTSGCLFIEKDNFIYEISYEQYSKFDGIIGAVMESNEIKNGQNLLQGTVQSFNFDNSEKTICVIKDKDNIIYNVDISNAKRYNYTNNGHYDIYINDQVNVYYQGQENSTDITAKSMYVSEESE